MLWKHFNDNYRGVLLNQYLLFLRHWFLVYVYERHPDCFKSRIAVLQELKRRERTMSNVLLAGDLLLMPWSHVNLLHKSQQTERQCRFTLHPAPGEELVLRLALLDDLLTELNGNLKVEVSGKLRTADDWPISMEIGRFQWK